MSVESVGHNRLIIDGYVYSRDSRSARRTFWNCIRHRRGPSTPCSAKAASSHISETGENIVIFRGPKESAHSHPPEPKSAEIARAKRTAKRRSEVQKLVDRDEYTREYKDSHVLSLVKYPKRHQEAVTKSAKKSFCVREQRFFSFGTVLDPNVSQETASNVIAQYDQLNPTNDLDRLSNSTVSSSALLSPLSNMSDDCGGDPLSITMPVKALNSSVNSAVRVESTQSHSLRSTSTKKSRKMRNKEMIELLSSTIDSTYRTIQQFSEIMAAKKEIPQGTPIEVTPWHPSTSIPNAILAEEVKEVCPLIDLTDDRDVEFDDYMNYQSDLSLDSTIPQANNFSDAPSVFEPEYLAEYPIADYGYSPYGFSPYGLSPSYDPSTYEYMSIDQHNMLPSLEHHFLYQSVTTQQMDTTIQHHELTLHDIRVRIKIFGTVVLRVLFI
ncbi:hypothetical protein QAD02_006726 [Eretmocerus hayati]|uniref:Uncharacterized protein n=1 Tax=Eretmocerus hayati TaxID=131215 RepID=A0ACC2N1P3_9HYME|nr:hypothetical protein QAD02_006726 [Eretmocerus hayati]